MARWTKAEREAHQAAKGMAIDDTTDSDVNMNTSTAQKRAVDSPTQKIAKPRRSNNKKANTGASPEKGAADYSHRITPGNRQDLNASTDSSKASQDSTKPLDILRQENALIVNKLSTTLPSANTIDSFLHAIAIIFDIKINFVNCAVDIKEQLMADFIYVLSDPKFRRNILYSRHNMETLAMFVTTPPVFAEHVSARGIKNHVDKLLQEILQKRGQNVQKILNLGWTEMCKLTGIFLPPNSIQPLDRAPLVKKILSAIRQPKLQSVPWYNKHALSHMSFYFGHEVRPVANESLHRIIPPFFTDNSFRHETRRAVYYKFIEAKQGEFPDITQYKSTQWCASGPLCQVDIFDASTTICSQCAIPVHPQCSSIIKNDFYCLSCHPDRSRQSWYCYSGSYIELPLAFSAPQPTFNDDDSQHTGGNPEELFDSTPGQEGNEFDDVNNANEVNQDVDAEEDEDEDNYGDGEGESVSRRLNLDEKDDGFHPPDELEPIFTSYFEEGFFISRTDLSLTLTTTDNDSRSNEEKFINDAKILLQKLYEFDEKITILPWKENSNLLPLDIDNLIPDFDSIQLYFNRAQVREDNPKVYCDVRLKHEVPWDALSISMRNWLQTHNTGMYYKKLQVENTRSLGWFLWSHRHIKVDRLAHVLANDNNVHVFFRYSKIYLGRGEKFALDEGVKAIFAICDSRDYAEFSTALKAIYHSSCTTFPLGIKLRFMPQLPNATEDLIIKQQRFRAQQEDFITSIITASSTDIRLLDARVGNKKTLRNVIMNLKNPETLEPMFLSVDSQWNNTARYIFAFIKGHEQYAIRMVNTLPAYLVRLKHNDVTPYFTVDAMERAKKLIWDNTEQCFLTEDEVYYHEMDQWKDATAYGLDTSDKPMSQIASTPGTVAAHVKNIEAKSSRVERIFSGKEACSIGTVTSKLTTKRLSGIMEDETTVGSGSTSRTERKQKDEQWNKKLLVLTANQAETTRTLEGLTILLNKALGINEDKTIRVVDPKHSTTLTVPTAGSTAVSGDEV